ncbi:hypothetical protein [uncultured Dialister sp.]|uniref:hypothetical protein n=1 Tax=uncultured Dialister sp. TaxID=278064 RepID=UPI002605176F|nr:hypothetical protein [uncultured Dialister sp.]
MEMTAKKKEKCFLYDMIPAPLWTIVLFIGLIPGLKPLSVDNYYQIAIGKIIVGSGIPHEIPLTVHTAEHLPYMAQQWLFMVFDYGVYSSFGFTGLFFCGLVLNMLLVYAVYRMLLCIGKGRRIIAYPAAVLLGFFPVLMRTMQMLRPYYITCILLALEIIIMERARTGDKTKQQLLAFPVLSILSINFHAAMWPMLLVMILPYAAENLCLKVPFAKKYFYQENPVPVRLLAGGALLIIVAGFLNPYGTEAMTYGIQSYGLDILRQYSSEMISPFYNAPVWAVIIIAFMGLDLGLTLRFHIPLSYLFLSLGVGIMALLSFRSLLLFLMFFMAPAVYLSSRFKPIRLSRKWGPVIFMILAALQVYLFEIVRPWHFYSPVHHTLINGANAIKEDAEAYGQGQAKIFGPGFLLNYFMLQGYQVYVFSSDEVFTEKMNRKHDIIREFLDIDSGRIPVSFLESQYGIQYYAVNKDMRLYDFLKHSTAFTLIYDSGKDEDFLTQSEKMNICIYRGPAADKENIL